METNVELGFKISFYREKSKKKNLSIVQYVLIPS